MRRFILLFLLSIAFSGYAQNTINNYKYVILPTKFSFSSEKDQYKLNSLAKLFLEEKGFKVYYDDEELPAEIMSNKCNALSFDLLSKKTMFSTNLTILLKDCKKDTIFKSKEGKSREKEYRVSYNMAMRDAFTSLNDIQYVYTEAKNTQVQEAVPAKADPLPVSKPVEAPKPVELAKTAVTETKQTPGTLYAQATANGYQLIDTAPKIVLTLFKTSAPDYFIGDNGTSKGIVLKKNGDWFFEYYKNDQLVSEKLSIKF
jgi:hypothetical protein